MLLASLELILKKGETSVPWLGGGAECRKVGVSHVLFQKVDRNDKDTQHEGAGERCEDPQGS